MIRRFFLAAIFALATALLPLASFAQLTQTQLVTLKAAIAADLVLSAMPRTADTAYFIAAEFSKQPAVPYIVWKTAVDRQATTTSWLISLRGTR